MSATISKSILVPSRFIFFMWAIFCVEFFLGIELAGYGIYPRTLEGLIGIVTAPFIHGNVPHVANNTLPLLFLGTAIFYFYDKIAMQVFVQCYFLTGILVWLFARSSFHIGASGLIYGLAFFLISFGIMRGDFKSIVISIIVFIFYNGLFYGVLPTQSGVSWESHLLGAIVGVFTAWRYSEYKSVSS
ncbi:rhomboid family intramembrane serine protease [Fulvivirgaceae bacterium BMA10]|uniref:Rhomboid family intramembrane serine protease n=1 Tax=Splendidivirga corallicola TaxID=3051826 RepID=A0ABT8KXT1_9BACT|nr:rhomboid family intramembrane serine protease [Fulvivirgaceae bacterium BMA10]